MVLIHSLFSGAKYHFNASTAGHRDDGCIIRRFFVDSVLVRNSELLEWNIFELVRILALFFVYLRNAEGLELVLLFVTR